MAYIGRQLARGENKLFDDISGSFNGSTTTFNLTVSSVATATATPYQLFVSLGGVMQKPNTDFTTAGNQITFTTAPAAGLSCWIMMQGDTIDQAAIPDASVTPSKISGTNFAFSGDLRLKDADGSHYVGFASPTTVSTNKVWTLPAADGSASQYLQTNGSGVLGWSTVSVGGATGIDFNDDVHLRFGAGNDLDIYHQNAATLNRIIGNSATNIQCDNLSIADAAGSATFANFASNGSKLYHNGAVKLQTTTDGLRLRSANDTTATLYFEADDGDDNADHWREIAQTNGNFEIQSKSTGSWASIATFAPAGLTVPGNLTVSGTTTTINTQTLDVEDKNVVIGKVSSPSDTTADGGGWTLKGATDKTFNWVNATDAWTSSEHIHLIDNKKLFVGGASGTTDGLEIVHNGSNSILNDSGTGTLQLQLGGSTKLEVTSGGINVTGAISVGGSPLASGSTFEAVANGSIANNKAVKLDSDGKVSQMAIAVTEVSNGSGTSSSGFDYEWVTTIDSSGGYYTKVAWDTANNRILYVWQDQGDNWKPRYQLGYFYSNNTRISFGNANYIINSANSDHWEIAYDPNRNKFLATCGKDYTSSPTRQGRSYVGTVNTGNTTVSWAQSGTWRSSVGETRGYLAYMNTPQRWVVYWRDVSSPYSLMVREGTMSSSGSMTWGNTATITTSATNSGAMDMAYDSTTDRLVVIYADDNSPNHGFMKIGRCDSSGNWSFGSQITFNTTHTKNSKITCANGKAYIVFANGSDSDRWVNITGTLSSSANTITLGSTQSGPGNNKLGSSGRHNLIYNDVIDKLVVSWTDTPSSSNPSNTDDWKIIKGSVSGNSISWETSSTYTLNGECGIGIELGNITGSGFNDQGVLVVAGTQPSYSNKNDMYLFHTARATPNLSNYYQYVGFADQAYTNGQTATIKTYGSVVDTLSGLTVGSEYFIQADGTVGTSWDSANFPGFASNTPFAGLAIGTTKLLLRDPNARN